MAKCLVLGANGFIGSHLVDLLVSSGHSVRAFDRFKNDTILFSESPMVEVIRGDFLNRDDLKQALSGIEYVFHFISTTTPIVSENDPLIDIETNIRMSVVLFEECAKANIKKVIFASTGGAIYGNDITDDLLSETVTPQPVSPYAIGKLTIEHYLRYFRRKHGLDSVVYRISNPYGDRQALHAKQGVIPIFLENILQSLPIIVYGDGSMIRDYIYIQDACDMIARSFEKATQQLYNIGSGSGTSLNTLVDTIRDIIKVPIEIEHKENMTTFVERIVLDTSRYNAEFGEQSLTPLNEGIVKTWEYLKGKYNVKD